MHLNMIYAIQLQYCMYVQKFWLHLDVFHTYDNTKRCKLWLINKWVRVTIRHFFFTCSFLFSQASAFFIFLYKSSFNIKSFRRIHDTQYVYITYELIHILYTLGLNTNKFTISVTSMHKHMHSHIYKSKVINF